MSEKNLYMHCPQYHSKCWDLQCTFHMLLFSNTKVWCKMPHIILLSLSLTWIWVREDIIRKCKTFKKAALILIFLFYQNMKEFLLTKEPLDIIRIFTILFVRVEQGEWTGNLEKEMKNFKNILQKILERVPSKDIEWKKKLQSFSIRKKLAKWVRR